MPKEGLLPDHSLPQLFCFLRLAIGGRGVRGARLHVVEPLGRDGELIRPGMRLISAAIGALAIGFALGLQAVPPGVSDSETIQPKHFDPWAHLGSQIPDSRRLRVASLKTEAVFEPATEGRDRQSELVLLRHKLRRPNVLVRAPQHGHRGKLSTSASINLMRMVAIEFGM